MGSRFGDVKGYLADATLDPAYAARMAKIIEAADARGMVVLVGCLYWGTSAAMDGLVGWQQAQANLAVANTVKWLSTNHYRNVFVDPDNEGMSPFTDTPLIAAAHAVDPTIMIACNRGAASISGSANDCGSSADLNIHYGPVVAGKPWLQSEGAPDPATYWGAYSKAANYNNYIRIGAYTVAQKATAISDAKSAIDKNDGYVLASSWLQAGSGEGIGGPFMSPGGLSNIADVNATPTVVNADAGVKWWLDAMKATYGAADGGVVDAGSSGGGGTLGTGGTSGAAGAIADAGQPPTNDAGVATGGSAGAGGASTGAGGTSSDVDGDAGNTSPPAQNGPAQTGCSCAFDARDDASGLGLASTLALAYMVLWRRRERRSTSRSRTSRRRRRSRSRSRRGRCAKGSPFSS
jgi:MYXO-CTERM domain-containing protein